MVSVDGFTKFESGSGADAHGYLADDYSLSNLGNGLGISRNKYKISYVISPYLRWVLLDDTKWEHGKFYYSHT